ncbi:hypothetical protein WJX75_004187 [Coccomyxa subellipsoidea]|uniref:Uncharacterized protein n=1 Tax=Coccomyxa subellipsoidea TaxID=248742 RepID=A0ABR2YC55_9CHLO
MESQSLLPAPDRTAFHTINPISRRLGHTVLCLSRRWGPVTGIQGVLLEPPRRPIKPKLLYVGVQAAAAAAMLASDGISSAKAALGHALREKPSPRISKSDEDFENMGVEFVWGYHDLNLEDLNDLFSRVGFPARNPEKLVRALSHTHRTLWIRSTRKSRMARLGQLLGFCRATSDGALSATIWDVAVHPAWQRA